MITREEFVTALDVVEAYGKQLQAILALAEKRMGVPLREFVERVEISPRVRSAVYQLMELGGEREIFLEEVSEFHFIRLRNTGRLSWAEFSEKREKYLRVRRI